MQKNKWKKHWDTEGSMKLEGFQECARKLQRMLDTRFANARQAFAIFEKSGSTVTSHAGTQCTCFTSTKVQILTPEVQTFSRRCRRWDAMRGGAHHRGGSQFT